MLWLYRLLFFPALIFSAPMYLRRMRRRGGYRNGFRQRFGAHPELPPKTAGHPRVWLQAVSVGEMLAIGPLLEELKRAGVEIYLTTTTSTGFRIACDRYLGFIVGIGYFPIDGWPFSARAWRRIEPDLAILTEGERWPEHLHQAKRRGVPVLCVNGRLSDRSFRRMKRFPSAARLVLGGIGRLLATSAEDAARFRELGMPAEKIFTTGNIKLDLRITPLRPTECAELRRQLGLRPGLVLLGSSTWPGEEEALLEAWRGARQNGLACSLLLVPRHAERRMELDRFLRASGVSFHFRSWGAAADPVDVAVGDTTGELRKLTQLADLVFVGKSLPPHTEGQTPVEAAALEKPIVFGPGMSNFRVLANDLLARGAAREVADAAALIAEVPVLLRDSGRRAALAAAGAQWHRENSGALQRTQAIIAEELAKLKPGINSEAKKP